MKYFFSFENGFHIQLLIVILRVWRTKQILVQKWAIPVTCTVLRVKIHACVQHWLISRS